MPYLQSHTIMQTMSSSSIATHTRQHRQHCARQSIRPAGSRLASATLLLAVILLLLAHVARTAPHGDHGDGDGDDSLSLSTDMSRPAVDPDDLSPVSKCYSPDDFSISLSSPHPFDLPDGQRDETMRLSFRIWNRRKHRPVRWDELRRVHDRRAHVVIASRDAQVFGHLHPEDFVTANGVDIESLKRGETDLVTRFDFRARRQWTVRLDITVIVPWACDEDEELDDMREQMRRLHGGGSGARLRSRSPHGTHGTHGHGHEDRDHHGHGHDHARHVHPDGSVAVDEINDPDLLGPRPAIRRLENKNRKRKLTLDLTEQFSLDFPTHPNPSPNQSPHPSDLPVTVAAVQVHGLPLDKSTSSYVHPIFLSQTRASKAPHTHPSVIDVRSPELALAAVSPNPAINAGACHSLLFHFSNATSRTPLANKMHPWLFAATHIAAIHMDTGFITHGHGMAVSEEAALAAKHVVYAASHWRETWRLSQGQRAQFAESTSSDGVGGGAADAFKSRRMVDGCLMEQDHHASTPDTFGPWLSVPIVLPKQGWWRVVVQGRAGDELLTPSFWMLAQ